VNHLAAIDAQFPNWNYMHPSVLYGLCRSLKPRVVVEVGTYRGYAACYMAQACKENGFGHVVAIDDFSEGMQKKYDRAAEDVGNSVSLEHINVMIPDKLCVYHLLVGAITDEC